MWSYLILFLIIIMLIYSKLVLKIKIKWRTFFEKGFLPVRGKFGLYCYSGKQGKGKTFSLVEYMLDNNKDIKVFSNISNIKGIDDITYYTGFKELIKIKESLDKGEIKTDKQLVIVYDEIFTELQRYSKINKDVLDFLCQMRKRKIIFLTTAQEWTEIPITFRRFCRYQIDCNMINLGFTGILLKTFKDAENMKWSNDEQEHIAPITDFTISKCRIRVANSYDTFLRISSTRPSASVDERAIEIAQNVLNNYNERLGEENT